MTGEYVATRRLLLTAASYLGAANIGRAALSPNDWEAFKARFILDTGRVVDNGNGGVSHSEGQGWGLLFAEAFADQSTFERVLSWTQQALKRPDDNLHAWRFVPGDRPQVRDLNNASDGDIFIATALARAGRRWRNAGHLQAAAALARDILSLLIRQVGSRSVLLPAVAGFESADAVIVNPSYYAFPFLAELSQLVPAPAWDALGRDGRALIEECRFGKWQLPPDWLRVTRNGLNAAPAPGWPPRFSYDAIRVPLWYSWGNFPADPMRQALLRCWSAYPEDKFPAWVDLATSEVAPYPASPGMVAVSELTKATLGLQGQPQFPRASDAAMYYDAALILLSNLAWNHH